MLELPLAAMNLISNHNLLEIEQTIMKFINDQVLNHASERNI